MANAEKEDVMHKRETIMADGRRKMYYFTFDEQADEADEKSGNGTAAKEDSSEEKTNE
ncbi:MAG: hypothetical protein P4L33_21070 [Capsulimonadaceae bacterium]|nr:hypothetical protein [Capsulimonadaceae bacterium]